MTLNCRNGRLTVAVCSSFAWMMTGGTDEAILELLLESPAKQPRKMSKIEAVGADVLGFLEDESIELNELDAK